MTFGNTVWVDMDAAGYSWFVDSTPHDNAEFRKHDPKGGFLATPSSPAYGDVDLLTVVMHEMGHVLGFEHLNVEADALMSASLSTGERHVAGDEGNHTQESPARLVVMEPADTETPIRRGVDSVQRSWLTDFLVNAANPNHDIRVNLLSDDGEKVHPNLRTVYSRKSRPWRI